MSHYRKVCKKLDGDHLISSLHFGPNGCTHVKCTLFVEKNPPRHPEMTRGNASILSYDVQTRRAEHRYEPAEGRRPSTTRPGASGAASPHGRLEWVCHQSGTDRVYINHREHYV